MSAARSFDAVTAVDDSDQRILDLLIGNIAEILNSEVALYCQPGGKGQPPEVLCSWGLGALHEQPARPGEGGFVGRALGVKRAALEPLHRDYDAGLLAAAGSVRLTHAVVAPVRSAAGAPGALAAAFSAAPPDPARTLWATESCAAMLALGVHQRAALDALLQVDRVDSLTGCLDYAGTLRELDREISRSARAGLNLSLCFLDLDNFKRVNSRHGHLYGNEVLAEVADLLRGGVRSYDTLGRFGGDEFIVILPGTSEAEGLALAERLRSGVAGASISSVEEPLSVSVGVASWRPGASAEQLIAHADQALLFAKGQRLGIAGHASGQTGAAGPLQ
jgi:diguanylate cyclase (GGDEF)-like protein